MGDLIAALREAVEKNIWAVHLESGVIGHVTRLYGDGEFVSPLNNKPVPGMVLELTEDLDDNTQKRHTFAVKGWTFPVLPLSNAEAKFFFSVQALMRHLLAEVPKFGKALKVDPARGVALLESALRAQLRLLAPRPEVPTADTTDPAA